MREVSFFKQIVPTMCFSKKMPMLFQLFFPSTAQLDELIAQQKNAPLSYPRTHEKLKGYDYDDNCAFFQTKRLKLSKIMVNDCTFALEKR